VSSFLRRRLAVADPTAFGWLELALPVDDEVVAHLNGVEVAHTTYPPHARGAAGSAQSHTLVDPSALVAGANLIAVELRHRGGPPDVASFNAELLGYAAPAQLVGMGAAWQTLDGSGAPPPGWKKAGFDDSTWTRGTAPLAVSGPIRLRAEFSVERGAAFRELLLRMARSDAGIAYLNRVEVARWNLPEPDSGVRTAAPASDAVGPAGGLVEIIVAPDLLSDGDNVLAIELYPRSGTESSPSFDLALVAVR
jgi:hypothetical protein